MGCRVFIIRLLRVFDNYLEWQEHVGHATPLGHLRSVYKSDAECRFLKFWVKMTLKVKVNDLHYSIPVESIQWCMLGTNLVIVAQIHYKLSHRRAIFPTILSQNSQNDLEGLCQWPIFSIPAKSIPGCMFGANVVILAQICDELSCRQRKVYRRMDRLTETGNNNTPLAWNARGKDCTQLSRKGSHNDHLSVTNST